MTLILKASGFRFLESLKEFCDRFPDVSHSLDNELQGIWICHKNSESIPTFEETNFLSGEDYDSLAKKVKRKIAAEKSFHSIVTEFSALSIFEKLYFQLGSKLATYLVTKTYLFYNWGINAFEPIFDHIEIHERIQRSQIMLSKLNRRKQCNNTALKDYNLSNRVRNRNQETVDLIESDMKLKNSKSLRLRFLIKDALKIRKYYEYTKNPRNPYQEMFSLNIILYNMEQRKQLLIKDFPIIKNVNDLILFIINIPVATRDSIGNKLLEEHGRWKELKKVLSIFINNHERLSKNNGFGRILKSHLRGVRKPSGKRLLPIPKSIVCTYIITVLRQVLPFQLFEQNRVRKQFFVELIKVIKGNKHETFIWHSLLQPLLMSKNLIPWIAQIDDYYIQSQVVLKVFKFIIFYYMFSIIRNNFYVTETGSSGFGLRYYLKDDMKSATTICLNKLLQNAHVSHLEKSIKAPSVERNWLDTGVIEVNDLKRNLQIKMSPNSEYEQPIAQVRFLPKSDDNDKLRIITYFPKKISENCPESASKRLVKFFKKRNSQRRKNLFFVKLFLEFLVNKKGLGIRPLPSDPRLEVAWERAVHLNEKKGALFFVKADILDAFNSIKYSILTELLRLSIEKVANEKVRLMKITEWKYAGRKLHKEVRFSFSNTPREHSVMIHRSFFLHSKKNINKCIDLKFLQIIKQIVMQQKISINKQIYQLKRGLAQGGAGRFSSQLCEIYYSSMDRLFFGEFINSSDSILLRAVDDYLFISSDIGKALRFLKIVQNGINEYNVRFNQNKLKSNVFESVQKVTYLGLIFNFENMTVKPDYSRYYQQGVLSTVKLFDKEGSNHFNKELFLRKRLMYMKSLKLYPIVINGIYNNLKTVRQIIFEACHLQSFRVLALANYLYTKKMKDEVGVFSILSRSCNKIRLLAASTTLSKDELNWLFFYAALKVVQKYSGQFKILVKLVKWRFLQCQESFASSGTLGLISLLRNDILDECKF